MLWFKTFFGITFQISLLALLIYLPAWTLNWPDALLWIFIFSIIVFSGSTYLLITKPESIEARMNFNPEVQPQEDKLATTLMFSAIVFGLILSPIDVFHLQISPVFSGWLKTSGLFIFSFGLFFVMAAMVANEFAETTVNIQGDRGQKVIDSGVYSLVRHPMYTGFIFFIIGTNIWLGTYLSLILSLCFLSIALKTRINIEEKTLIRDLEGYEHYCKRVKARVIPYFF
tara:strand:+ start:552 stop:1235 length:684 start_codon:yes stop_codon:yes gene_type:complete